MTRWHQLLFQLRTRSPVRSRLRKIWYRLCGMQIGPATVLSRVSVKWPHYVRLWNCFIEPDVIFHISVESAQCPAVEVNEGTYIGRNCEFNVAGRITIGPRCLIASGCKFVDHDHKIQPISETTFVMGAAKEILLGDNVWLGSNVIVLKGVEIGEGAIVAAGAVVTKSIPPFEIWGGVPARKISQRPASAVTEGCAK